MREKNKSNGGKYAIGIENHSHILQYTKEGKKGVLPRQWVYEMKRKEIERKNKWK